MSPNWAPIRTINNEYVSGSIPGQKPGTHFHFDPKSKGGYSEEVNTPGHTHKNILTGIDTEVPTPLNERPDLTLDGDHKKKDTVVKVGSKYEVRSKAGKTLGSFGTKAEAVKRLGEIEGFKKSK